MNKNTAKYKNAVLYFAHVLNQYQLGSVKLAKLLYYLDFISYRDNKKPVTGTTYYKQEFGPLAKDLVEIIGELVEEKKLKVERTHIPKNGRETNNYRTLKTPSMDVFNEYERILLRKLANKYGDVPTEQIIGKAHLEMPWAKAEEGAPLDYAYSFDIDDFNEEVERESKEEDKVIIEALEAEVAKQ